MRSSKEFVVVVELGVGEHTYTYCVDGRWLFDANQPWTHHLF